MYALIRMLIMFVSVNNIFNLLHKLYWVYN